MGMRLVTAPAEEPVSLEQAKAHLRVDLPDDDALIGMLISAARAHAENICRRAFVTQQWDLFLDSFPLRSFFGELPGYVPVDQLPSAWMTMRQYAVRFRGGRIDLPFPALQSVDSVQYTNPSGTQQTLAPGQYVVDNVSEPGVLTPAPGTYWPDTLQVANAVQIRYTAGYGAAAAVPPSLKAWILMRVGAMYENREEIVVGQRVASVDLPFVDRLLDPYRIWSYA